MTGERRIEANGLSFYVHDEGEGPPVLLLHGWPDTSDVWRHQIPALVGAGFRVAAPDLRGRGRSDMPDAVEAYGMGHILRDVAGILDALEIERAHVVGHDWGAIVAWLIAALMPERVERLVAVSVGHPAGFTEPTGEDLARSWYIWLFLFEGVAEGLLPRDDWKLLRELLGHEPERVDRYIEDLSRPGALTASLNWYRANNHPSRFLAPPPTFPPIKAPTLGVYGAREVAVSEKRMTGSAAHVEGPWRYERFDEAGHWIQVEQPERFNELLIEFLTAEPAR